MLFDVDIRKSLPNFDLHVVLQSNASRLGLLGVSGSGKSLTIQLVAGLLQADGGHIRIRGETWLDKQTCRSVQQRHVGMVFQDYALFPHLTVAQNIAFGLKQGILNPNKRPSEKVVYWLEMMKLGHIAHQYPQQVSGGQKQRVALARALAVQPKLLLLDEPFSALDADLRVHMRMELAQLQAQFDVPMILITHDQADVEVLADEVWCMQAGHVRKVE